jgi:hypothetical protein
LAVKGSENPAFTVAVDGAMLNITGTVVMVTVADAETEGLAVAVAVTMAVPPWGTESGAV